MAADIAPALLEKIQADFAAAFEADKTIKALYAAVEAGTATYAQANEFAVRTGALLTKALKAHLSSSVLPDGRMYYNIAKSLLTPTFRRNYELITGVTSRIQESLNAAAGIGLKAQVPKFNQDRLDGIIDRLSSEPDFDQVAWILREPVVNFSQSVVDDCVKVNAQFLRGAGLRPKIVRTLRGRACPWCKALAGTYYYDEDNVPDDIYRRHDNCRCTVEVFTETGDRTTVHSGTEGRRRYVKDKYGGYELTEEARIARRKEMEATAAERAKAAREKRIATWAKKKQDGWTLSPERAKIEARKSIGKEAQRQFQSEELLQRHYGKHQAEFGDISIPEYLSRANTAADRELSDDVVQLIRSDGSTSKYCFSTNEFVVINQDGSIRTYFLPQRREAYWQDELDRN